MAPREDTTLRVDFLHPSRHRLLGVNYFSPSATIRIPDRFLVFGGAATGWYFASSGDGDTLNPRQVGFAVLPRLGYAFQLGDGIALWPRISADIAYAVIGKNTDPVQLKGLLFSLTFGVPLVINLSKQFAMTLTPSFDFPLLGELTKQGGADVGKLLMMNAGATLGIVGWL